MINIDLLQDKNLFQRELYKELQESIEEIVENYESIDESFKVLPNMRSGSMRTEVKVSDIKSQFEANGQVITNFREHGKNYQVIVQDSKTGKTIARSPEGGIRVIGKYFKKASDDFKNGLFDKLSDSLANTNKTL